jgi:hypothetical protein
MTGRRAGWRHGAAGALATAALLMLASGCVSWPVVGPSLLVARADQQAAEGAWHHAIASYDEFLERFPDDRLARRVLESRNSLVAMMTARAELTRQRDEAVRLREDVTELRDEGSRLREDRIRLRDETTLLRWELIRLRNEQRRLREELNRREGDLARTREELAARQAEAQRLRDDIERLKQIDLRLERKR